MMKKNSLTIEQCLCSRRERWRSLARSLKSLTMNQTQSHSLTVVWEPQIEIGSCLIISGDVFDLVYEVIFKVSCQDRLTTYIQVGTSCWKIRYKPFWLRNFRWTRTIRSVARSRPNEDHFSEEKDSGGISSSTFVWPITNWFCKPSNVFDWIWTEEGPMVSNEINLNNIEKHFFVSSNDKIKHTRFKSHAPTASFFFLDKRFPVPSSPSWIVYFMLETKVTITVSLNFAVRSW